MSTFLLLEVFIKIATVSRGKQCSAFTSFSALLRAHSLAVVQWRSQTNYRILEEVHRMYLNALDSQANLYSEMISLNYLPDNVPLDAKFILESNSSRTMKIADISNLKNDSFKLIFFTLFALP